MNKLVLSILTLGIFANSYAQESIDNLSLNESLTEKQGITKDEIVLDWQTDFKDALKKSKKEKKPVLIYFTGSDWCGPCKILDKNLFHSKKFKDMADKDLILYEANNPQNKDLVEAERMQENYKLISKYKVKSYPTLVFVNHKGKMIGYKKGLILTEYYYPFIESVIENY